MSGKLFIPLKGYLRGKFGYHEELTNYLAIEMWANNLSFATNVIFDFPGPLYIAVWDIYCPPVDDQTLSQIQFSILVAGATATQIGILKNGTTEQTVTIPAGTTEYAYTVSPTIAYTAQTDKLQLSVVTPGGAGGLTGVAVMS